MRKFHTNPDIPSIEPTFRTPQEAILYQPTRHAEAMADSARLHMARVKHLGFGDHHATIWAERNNAIVVLDVLVKPKRAEWTVRGPLERHTTGAPPAIDDHEPVALYWPALGKESVWDRAETLRVLLGRTLNGVRCTEEYIYLYAEGLNPFAFTKLYTSDPDGVLLWWNSEDP